MNQIKNKIFIFLSFLLLITFLNGCLENNQAINVNLIKDEPDEFIDMNEEQIKEFPNLKLTIQKIENTSDYKSVTVEIPSHEFSSLHNFLKNTNNIRYNEKFYEIVFYTT